MKPHGLKGEVTVSIDTEMPNDFTSLDILFLNLKGQLVPYFIDSVSVKGNKAFVKFNEINTLEQAEIISKSTLYLPKSARPKAAKGEFYTDEVSGFAVEDENHGLIGTVRAVVQAGRQRLLSIEAANKEKEILIPVNNVFIKNINRQKAKITVSLPEGFLDLP